MKNDKILQFSNRENHIILHSRVILMHSLSCFFQPSGEPGVKGERGSLGPMGPPGQLPMILEPPVLTSVRGKGLN